MIARYLQALVEIHQKKRWPTRSGNLLVQDEIEQQLFYRIAQRTFRWIDSAAKEGESFYEVPLPLTNKQYHFPTGGDWRHFNPVWLKGAGELLYIFLEFLRLRPTVEISKVRYPQHKTWVIVAHWEKDFQPTLIEP